MLLKVWQTLLLQCIYYEYQHVERALLSVIQIDVSSYDIYLEVNILICCYINITSFLSCLTVYMTLLWLLKQMMHHFHFFIGAIYLFHFLCNI